MSMTSNAVQDRVVPYWNEIKKLGKEEKLKLIALISNSLVSQEAMMAFEEDEFCSQLSPDLMQGLAEFAVKEHRAGHCISHGQIEKSIMESMGWK